MSLREFEERHTLADLEEIAALSSVKRDEEERNARIRRVEQQAQQNRRQA